jgi:uncharacterized protein (DUF1501 family)
MSASRQISRRRFLGGTAALSAVRLPEWMPRLAFRKQGAPQRGDTLVCIFQRGGMDGLSAVVPYEEQRYFDLRPRIAFKQPGKGVGSVLPLTDQFGLSPGLAGLKQIWDDGRLSVVHATGSPHGSRSHFEAMGYMERGTPGQKSINTGWLGRHLNATARRDDSPFRAIGFGSAVPQSLRGPIPAASLRSISDFHLKGNEAELARFKADLESLWDGSDWLSEDTRATFEALETLEKADPAQYAPENGADYPETALGQGLKQIAQLIKADLGLEVACIDMGGWDTHASQVWTNNSDPTHGRMHNLLKQLDQAILAFYKDLGQSFDDPGVTLLTMSEFGRRVGQNTGNGTDHGEGSCMFIVSGAAVQGVHTQWPGLDEDQLARREDLAITTDYRDVLGEILLGRMGNAELPSVFPQHDMNFRGVVRHRADAPAKPTGASEIYMPYTVRAVPAAP